MGNLFMIKRYALFLPFILFMSNSYSMKPTPKPKNAGVLPYAIHQDITYILLGKEQDGTWSDYGGGAESEDKSEIDVATREFRQESGYFKIKNNPDTEQTFKKRLSI